MKKMLVVYYSWSNGNTKKIAEALAKAKGADLARIETETPYEGSYQDVVNQGQCEVKEGFCPKLLPLGKDIADYDVIAVGTPTWWYTMAPAVRSFLTGNDFSGKTLVPFMTNGGWPGHVLKDMAKAAHGANVAHGMEVRFDSTGGAEQVTPESEVAAWMKSIQL